MDDAKGVYSNTIGFWIATRLNGGSASMNAPMGPMDKDLLSVLDSRLYDRVKIAARNPHAEGVNIVATTPEPKGQKFPVGSRVKIADDLGPAMRHFSGAGKLATVEYTYGHAFSGGDVQQYSLDVDGIGSVAWYYESQLSTHHSEEDFK